MRNSLIFTIAVLGLCLAVKSQESGGSISSTEKLSDGIQKGDVEDILQAGRSGDPSFVPQLLAHRRKAGKHIDLHEARAIQLALAKLGQQSELREVRCEFLFGDPPVQYDAVDKLQYLGGWFSIETVADVLNNPNYQLYKKMGPDSALAPIGWYAVRRLPALVPNPPSIDSGILPPSSDRDLERQRAWKDWIDAHKESLRHIAPSTEEVKTSSDICEGILKDDRTFDHAAKRTPDSVDQRREIH